MQLRPTTVAPACSACRQASSGLGTSRIVPSRWTANVTTAGRPAARIASSARSASPSQLNVSAMTKSAPASAAQATCSSKASRASSTARVPGSYTLVLHRFPASNVPVSLATAAAMDRACRFSGSRMSSLPMTRSLARWP